MSHEYIWKNRFKTLLIRSQNFDVEIVNIQGASDVHAVFNNLKTVLGQWQILFLQLVLENLNIMCTNFQLDILILSTK